MLQQKNIVIAFSIHTTNNTVSIKIELCIDVSIFCVGNRIYTWEQSSQVYIS